MSRNYLIVVAHPDDEALGAGALIHHLSTNGDKVSVCILSHLSPTRYDDLKEGVAKSHSILGVSKVFIGDFECMRFKDAEHHEVVKFIESCIINCEPDVVITHHPADIHIDHGITAECCLEASKLPQRQIVSIPPIKSVMFMEVPSSTDWNIYSTNGSFAPNWFISVNEEDVLAKIDSIKVYKDVIRKHPHPRSVENIKALATIRGAQSGVAFAEAFQLAFALEE